MVLSYGMLCEGDSDLYTLEIICKRLAERQTVDIQLIKDISEPVAGPITKLNVKTKTRMFIAREINFGVYFADHDKGVIDKNSLIKDGIEFVDQLWLDSSAIGVPVPHLEEWLLCDEDFIKKYLGLSPTKPLPHPKEAPKNRLQALVSQHGPDELTIGEFRRITASEMNIDIVLQKSQSFERFSKSFSSVLSRVS